MVTSFALCAHPKCNIDKAVVIASDVRHQLSITFKSPVVMHSDLPISHLYSSILTFNPYSL